ncbi:MAG: AMP-dependent synthetase and ligase [Halanaerobium sp. 4-GBenrich]|uniref:Long-chain acyl-CoA synthetase n=1 Tax=Halanaerobium congolense TaxID=54121 RepID=A0A1G6RYG2_9FIRM|nr:long-chain fatty acid--CoA ligase [Halanaerobium congolense]KXS50125.1 MAG: AMP-dependent synthetase and ligase [Halanaerobium sp. T82-1]ODS49944.1 MAG: AMP-dependent synthetase and ligase [Halanaerobium sp. 4-GBenrich]OEG62912.1 MAG: long-chain-fatty-acid--CoA ligase [Halanaerobium sp. MDAL1]PUU92638.1 MAG: AMP-dependent synthetase and ligase [Halanaerobium sp.]PTX17878.1 long-chain acyl-CoA synthetase [Halanaerobium congolense]
MLLGDIISKTANEKQEKLAAVLDDQKITYSQLEKESNQLAHGLIDLGIKTSDMVSIMLSNSIEFLISYVGVIKSGATMVPLNISFKTPAVEYILNNSEAKAVITSKKFLPLIQKCDLDHLENIILVDGEKSDNYLLLSEFKNKKTSLPKLKNIDQEYTAACLYTSGTTGQPKGAMLTHHNLIFDTQKTIEYLKVDDSDRYICVLPMFHAFAETVCILMPLFLGAEIVIIDKFLPETVLKIIQEQNVTFFAGVPTMYSALLNVKNKDNYDLSHLNLCISGGAAMPKQTMEDFEKTFNVKILEGNGPTETSPVAYVNPVDGARKSGSVGLPIPKTEVKIVDENDNEVPIGEIGEITVKGENVMKGYYKMPEATKKALRGGWLHTGDLGKMDEDGYVYIVDRKKDMINVGGMNVYPREIEEQLYKHPKIREAAVVATKDELRGEIPKAVIVLRDGESATEREIQKYCMKYFANYKVPKLVDFLDELPKNATGKIDKKSLSDLSD